MQTSRSAVLFVSGSFGTVAVVLAACGGTVTNVGTDLDAGLRDATVPRADGGQPDSAPIVTPDTGALPDAGPDPVDAAEPPDDGARAPDAAVTCGTATCTSAQVCCATARDGGVVSTCETSCADGGFTLACDGPEDCTPTGASCCATLSVGPGQPPLCPLNTAGAACKTTCTQSIPFNCPAQGKVRLCHKGADCAAGDPAGYTSCCTFQQGNGSATICVPSAVTQFATSCAP